MTTLKFGRKAPKDAPALMLRQFLATTDTSVIPAHPVSEDYFAEIRDWQMLGNDQWGDCVGVTWANERHALNMLLKGNSTYPSLDQVITFYKTQNPNFPAQDEGMVIQTALEELVHNGGPDGVKALAFAKVDHTNLEEVKAALAIFGMLWVGIDVQDANMEQFDRNQAWDYVAGSPNDGGHSVVAGGYLGKATGDVRFITWAQETEFTDRYWETQVEEAWVVIWPEHLEAKPFQVGVDQAALAAAYTNLTGRPFPVAVTPTPEPTPEPAPITTVTRSFTPEQAAALSDWADYPHVWKKATAAAKAWHNAS